MRGLSTACKEQRRLHPLCRRRPGRSQIGIQSIINIGVNLQLMPAKGMTLPLISYGGSSLIAIAVTVGMVLALTRHRPEKRKQPAVLLSRSGRCAGGVRHGRKARSCLPPAEPAAICFPAEALAHELKARG